MVTQTPPRRHTGGPPPKLTPEIVTRVAERCAKGLPIHQALALDELEIPQTHWQQSLERLPKLARVFHKIQGLWTEAALDRVNSATCKTLPGVCWTLERTQRDSFGGGNQGARVQVNVNTVIGLGDDVLRRAAAHLRRGEHGRLDGRGMKQLGHGKPLPIVDVQTIPQDKSA